MIFCDTEGSGLDQYAPGFFVFMCQWADADGEYVCDMDTGFEPFLAAIAADPVVCFANASFDIAALKQAGIVDLLAEPYVVHDVQTLARVAVRGRFSYRLEDLGSDLLSMDATEAQRALKDAAKAHGIPWTQANKDYVALWRAEPDLMVKYGKEDVALTRDLWNLIWSRCTEETKELYAFEHRVARVLRQAERDGICVDAAAVERLQTDNEAEAKRLRALLLQDLPETALGWDAELEADGTEVSPRQAASREALLRGLLEAGVKLYKKSPKSGVLTTRADALAEFEHVPVVGNLIAWRRANRILATYVPPMRGVDRIHTSFRQVEARTSRMSTARPSLQNLPRVEKGEVDASGVRACLVPTPGNALVVCDFDSIEIRVLAYYLNSRRLDRLLDDGMDFHSRTAAEVFGAGVELDYENYLKGGPNDHLRTLAKTVTFTIVYGGGAPLLSARLGKPVEECVRLKSRVIGSIPGFWDLWDGMGSAAQRRGYMATILGRKLHSPKDKPHVALNTAVQGSSAEIMKLGMLAACEAVRPFGGELRLVVHDEAVFECPVACAEQVLSATIEAMESCWPLRPKLKVTGSWSELSYAHAK